MQRTKLTYRSFKVSSGKKHHGFTLAELIVVLAVLAIMATVGVVTIFGHIKKSNFEQNSQNAVSVYQAAQSALSQKVANGTQNSWTRKLVELKCSDDQIVAFEKDLDKNNESNTMKLSLTFNPNSPTGSEDSYLYNLLSSEFYDKTIFAGTMAIELDVVATYSKGKIFYSSWVSSAFYCKQNDSETGWDGVRKGENSPDGLPQRNPYSYRRDTSLVGWFDGTADSVTGPDGVCPVYIPQTIINELDGHILADSTDSGYLVNLRNGETLDVSWAILDTDGNLRDDHGEEGLEFTLVSEETDYGNAQKYDDVKLKISQANLITFRGTVASQSERIVHECVNSKTNITRYERTALITVEVDDGYSSTPMQFPMTISRVIGDDRVGCPNPEVGYYEYRLSIDCMILRSDEANTPESRFNAERLFGLTPRNISATFSCAFDQYNEGGALPKNVDNVKAARAIDDPVYFTGVAMVKGNTSYCYTVRAGMAAYDGEDNPEAGTTGKCVVNTLFGDYKYNDTVNGTSWTFDGGDAVITSFRHLYNIRWIQNGTVNYRIVRNLDWYTNKSGLLTVSDVKVFSSDGKYRTPAFVTEDTDTSSLKIVPFPAIRELRAGQTLTSMSKANGTKYSINNLQMRATSFVNDTDEGYGVICKNSGTIYNIYTNNFNLVLSAISDTASSDYDHISESDVTIAAKNGSTLNKAYYVGGLVGLNHGNIGNSGDSADDNENVIMMSNSIILACQDANDYWSAGNYDGVGGVIGKNVNENEYSPTLSGTIEINGRFAVVGNNRVGGVIAYSNADIGARIVVDGNSNNTVGASGFTLPKELSTGSNNNLSCVIAGTNTVGGAIGYLDNCSLTYTVPEISVTSYDQVTNEVEYADHDEDYYQIYVDLPEDSLIVDLDIDKDDVDVGGAIGYMLNCSGDYMSVYVKNLGNILIRDKSSKTNVVGGAIGRDNGSSIKNSFLTVFNGNGAIGSYLDNANKPLNRVEYCGGVYGRIENVSASDDRTIFMDVTNDGTQISAISDNGDNQGAGGAIGVLMEGSVKLIANITNEPNTRIVYNYSNDYKKNIGAGGAIGAIQKKDNSYLASGSNVFVENNGYIYARYNAGGVIGVMNANHGGIYAYNNGSSIEGDYCVGGAIGWCKGINDGNTRSILSGAMVKGHELIGGAIGRNPNLQGGTITTKVYGNSTVSGTGSVIGGVCGDVRVQGDGTGSLVLDGDGSTLEVSTKGKGVGGVAGILRANITNYATVRATDVVLNVSGSESVGGGIGRIRSTSFVDSDTSAIVDTESLVDGSNNKTGANIMVDVDIVLPHPSTIVATGANVGGAIGFVHTKEGAFGGKVSVSSESGSTDDIAYIRGTNNIGGAIGHFGSSAPNGVNEDSGINVDFSDSPITIEATVDESANAYLGGAVGYFDGNNDDGSSGFDNNTFKINVILGNSTITSSGSYVGGAIGYNKVKNGDITVSLNGTINGNLYVSGGIGSNRSSLSSVAVSGSEAEIYGSGDYVGGAIGYNNRVISGSVSADYYGGSSISGVNYVGGAIGFDENNINSVSAEIDESTTVVGDYYIGGAIGRVSNKDANFSSISVFIGSGSSISGIKYLGGAVGSIGTSANKATIGTVSVVIDSAIPIIQTEDISKSEEACIGGVIGVIVRGTINKIELSGSGGDINPQIDVQGSDAPYYPIANGVLISGSGKCIGGIIGLIGDSAGERDVKIVDISVDDYGPSLAVVSSNGAQGIGGWIGTCYSKAIIGDSKTALGNLSIKTVKVVYSKGECVGGFIGYVGKTPTNAANKVELFVNIDMELSSAYICGLARTGGVYGDSNCVGHYGTCDLNICDNTSIGDYKGDIETDDITGCFCIEAGGFAGRFSNRSVLNGNKNNGPICEITVTIDDTSRVFAGGTSAPEDCEVALTDAGVGGAIGRLGGSGGGNNEISVNNGTAENITDHYVKAIGVISSSSKPTVYSAYSHAGGAIGHMLSNCLSRSFSTACVRQVGPGYTGGFVGKMDAGSLKNCYSGGHTFGGQYVPDEENVIGTRYVGGFVGYVGKDISTIYQSYSTSSVRSTYTEGKDIYLGGFIGGTDPSIGNDKFAYVYCTGLVSAPNEVYVDGLVPNDGTVYVGAFAGYLPSVNVCKSGKECGRTLMYINEYSGMGRVGNISEALFDDGKFNPSTNANVQAGVSGRNSYSNRVLYARWGSWGENWYIKHNKDSKYTAQPFDTYLKDKDGSDDYFPLRTFISIKVSSNAWKGEHWGDWPVFPEDKILLDKDNSIISLSLPADGLVFNGTQVTIEDYLEITYNGKRLELDRDYALKYSDNDKLGTATVRITAIGDYYGSYVRQFVIKPADISDQTAFTITVPNETPYMDGAEVKPPVTVVYKSGANEITLVENKDYTLEYSNNVDPGLEPANVKITGIGNYTGSVDVKYTILPVFAVNFEAGGETVYDPQRIVKNQLVEKPEDPKLTGHIFVDWYKDAELTTKYNFADPVTDNLTIYAKWTKEQYVVNFVDNGGVPVEAQTVEYNDIIDASKISEQIKTDCTFVGWYSDEECTQEFALDTPVTGAMTLYALWKDNPLVTYSGTNIPSERIEYNSCITKPADPIKEHFTFVGWYKDAEFETEYDFSEQVTGDIVIYAKWISNPTIYLHISDTPDEIEVAYEYDLNDLSLSEPVKEGGYEFVGWYADEEFNEEFDFDMLVTEDVHIYAKFVKVYVVTYVLDDESGEITATVDEGKTFDFKPEKDGLVFDRWFVGLDLNDFSNPFDADIPITKDVQLHASWKEACTVTMVISDDEAPEIKIVGKGDEFTYVPVREGYTFLGWYEEDPNVLIDFSTIVINRDYNIHALWEEET